jgi:hypothetical protein
MVLLKNMCFSEWQPPSDPDPGGLPQEFPPVPSPIEEPALPPDEEPAIPEEIPPSPPEHGDTKC